MSLIYFVLLFILITTSYFIGSIPFGLIITKIFHIKNISTNGHSYISTTYLWQTNHHILAIIKIICEIFKLIAIAIILFITIIASYHFLLTVDDGKFGVVRITNLQATIQYLSYLSIPISAAIGHIFPIWSRFKGSTGELLIFCLILAFTLTTYSNISVITLATISCTWLIVLLLTHYIFLANIIAIIAFPIVTWLFPPLNFHIFNFLSFIRYVRIDFLMIYNLIVILILIRNRGHISRLLKGQEPKFSLWKKD